MKHVNRMKARLISLSMVLLVLLLPAGISAQTLKIASLAPENSDYGRVLNKINAEWLKISGGKVKLMIIHNGAAGGEDEVLRKMKQGTIQGGMFTSAALAKDSPIIVTLSAPLLIRTDAELKYVLPQIKKELDDSLARNGMVAVAYARGGWIYVYSKQPFKLPSDVKQRKLASTDTDKATFGTLQALGYRPISVALTDYLVSLNSNLIDTIMSSPVGAAQFQWFGIAKYMLDLRIAPFLGAVVIDEKAWKRVPEELRGKLLEAATQIVNRDLEPAVEKLEATAIATMKDNGLVLMPVDAATRKAWEVEFETGVQKMLEAGGYDKVSYGKIKSLLGSFKE